MSLILKENAKSGGDFAIAPAGNHVGICYQMIDLGQQYTAAYDKWQPKVLLGWELPHEKMDDGRPFMVSSRYTMSFHEKAILRRDLESWRGRPFTDAELAGFDLKAVLGKACMINVVHNEHNGKTYANVKSVAAMPKGMEVPELTNDLMVFEFGDQGYDEAKFSVLPEWMQQVIMQSKDYEIINRGDATTKADLADDDFSDDIPF